jgi:choice-of-anchor B domain-containing protein
MCFSSNEDTLTIHDVSDKSNIELVSRTSYLGATYTHQGWLTPNQRYFLLGDEVDELAGEQTRTATYVWDMRNLDNPRNTGVYNAKTKAIDHNLYIKGRFTYQSNYRAGLRILDNRSIKDAFLFEVGYFDIFPKDDATKFNGTWSNYPYFKSGKVIVNGIEQGLYVLRPQERTLRRTADRMAERRIG